MSAEQRQAVLAFLLASRSGAGFLHDINHVCGDLSRISAPTLIIESRYDGSKDEAHALYAADHIRQCRIVRHTCRKPSDLVQQLQCGHRGEDVQLSQDVTDICADAKPCVWSIIGGANEFHN